MDQITENEKQAKDVNDIMGFGTKIKVLYGTKKSVEDESKLVADVREIHLTPCSLKNIPEMFQLLNKFFDKVSSDVMHWSQDQIKDASRIIFLSTRKMHPELKEDEISDLFGLGGLAKSIRVAMDINDFLSEVRAMNSQVQEVTLSAQKK